MYSLLKLFFFRHDPEKVHLWVMSKLKWMYSIPPLRRALREKFSYASPSLEKELWGIRFPNPVGLAAGFDKDAKHIDELSLLGFGFIEIGTLTPLAQDGNPKPRLFRLPKDKALINRMGFNNEGVDKAVERLKGRSAKMIVGGNIGKNKDTPNEAAAQDYEICFRKLYDHVDYFTINVSSPNTPGLRALQDKEPLSRLLSRLQEINTELGRNRPILLKIAPDLNKDELDDIIDIVRTTRIQGIVATNTTIARTGLRTNVEAVDKIGNGGLSGLPVRDKSTDVIRYIHQKTKGEIPIVAVGGIFTAEDARDKLAAGASLIQVYTGFIYEGPGIARDLCKGIS